jgi:arylformamidase
MPRIDPAWLDRMYNNRALVPEHGAHFARWAADSAAARASQPCSLDIAYGSGVGETLDVFAPTNGGPAGGAPVLVFIHGGYWRALDKADHSFIAPAFTVQGACVVVPNYALCPAVSIPDITLQMVRALAWVARNIQAFGGDPARIVVAGHSAGGHLAAMLLLCRWRELGRDLPAGLVRRALSISGVFDLAPLRHTPFVKDDLRLTPAQVAKASPARLPAPRTGTLAAVVGGDESPEFIRQNRLIRDAWGPRAVPVCEELPGRNHFSALEALVEPGQRLHALALGMLQER